MIEHYKHTQIGWVILLTFILISGFMSWWFISFGNTSLSTILVGVLLLVFISFATLTTSVNNTHMTIKFGIGLFRKRIELSDIRYFETVKNPWYYGWGIHYYPGGIIYNISGFEGIELTLNSGKKIRIGTDEPAQLCQAIEKVIGKREPLDHDEIKQVKTMKRKSVIFIISLLAVIGIVIGIIFYYSEQQPEIVVSSDSFRVKSLFYSVEYDFKEITHFSLEQKIPRILARTNGYGGGRTLRGHFRLQQLGDGQLFIEYGIPPYLYVCRGKDYVFVNCYNPEQTKKMFHELESKMSTLKSDDPTL